MILPFNTHDNLNPILWDGQQLIPEVHVALLRIAKEYWKFLNIDTAIVDIVISGSQANYNYNIDSDIDLHIIADYSKVSCDDSSVEDLFMAKRDLWRDSHHIDIHGVPVEVYVEDVASPAKSSTYSILFDKWIKTPQRPDIVTEYEKNEVTRLCKAWIVLISNTMLTHDLHKISKVKKLLWDYRKVGLSVHGEFGIPNLVFKTLRSNGVTDMLIKSVSKLHDDALSLEQRDEL